MPPAIPAASAAGPAGFAAAFRAGARAAVPTFLAIVPFAAIFGALATATGLDLVQTMGMTMIVAAGASQLAALQLMDEGAPALVAILTGAVVNMRMAMYSAALAAAWPAASLGQRAFAAYFIHDQSFAMSIRRYGERPAEPFPVKMGFFLGVGITGMLAWFAATLVGALFGARVPPEWGLDFAVPATFIALTAPLLRTLPHVIAALTASVIAVLGTLLPLGVGLLLAVGGGVAAGLMAERSLGQ